MSIAKMIDKLRARLRPRLKVEKWEDVITWDWERGRIRRFDWWVTDEEYQELYDLLCRKRGL